MKSFIVTVSMGKRLIAKATAAHFAVKAAQSRGTLVIVAGTTNGYVAEEILGAIGQGEGFSRRGFRRGMTLPAKPQPPLAQVTFPGDVIVVDGVWQKGKTIFDVADGLKAGDVILKGANAVNLATRQAAVLIGDPQAGTAGAAIRAAAGRRARLIVPVGLEKRVTESLGDLAAVANAPESQGPRLLPLPGAEIITEIEALRLLTGTTARLLAAGGIHGAEGAVWLAVEGDAALVKSAETLLQSLADEPPCQV